MSGESGIESSPIPACRTTLPESVPSPKKASATTRPVFKAFSRNFATKAFETGQGTTLSAAVNGGNPLVTYYASGRAYNENGPFTGKRFDTPIKLRSGFMQIRVARCACRTLRTLHHAASVQCAIPLPAHRAAKGVR